MDQAKQDLGRKDSELLALRTKLDTLNNQFSDSKQHVDVLKESLTAKEQRAAILQTEVNMQTFFGCMASSDVFCGCVANVLCVHRWTLCASVWRRRSLYCLKRVSRYQR